MRVAIWVLEERRSPLLWDRKLKLQYGLGVAPRIRLVRRKGRKILGQPREGLLRLRSPAAQLNKDVAPHFGLSHWMSQ
jgi:hypothetical protein